MRTCKRGHDLDAVGQTKSGQCAQCKRQEDAARYRAKKDRRWFDRELNSAGFSVCQCCKGPGPLRRDRERGGRVCRQCKAVLRALARPDFAAALRAYLAGAQ